MQMVATQSGSNPYIFGGLTGGVQPAHGEVLYDNGRTEYTASYRWLEGTRI
jgi:hypothetical protein